MPSSNATRNKRRKQKRAQETLQEKEQRRLERRQKYAARDPETIESQRKRRNERDRQTYAAMDKDEKKASNVINNQRCATMTFDPLLTVHFHSNLALECGLGCPQDAPKNFKMVFIRPFLSHRRVRSGAQI